MTRTLTVVWLDPKAFEGRDGAPIRLLAVSDDVDRALDYAINREKIGRIDAVVGAGDLEPSYLCFLGDAFGAPVAYVRGNHDRGGHWMETLVDAPQPLSRPSNAWASGQTTVRLRVIRPRRRPVARCSWRLRA